MHYFTDIALIRRHGGAITLIRRGWHAQIVLEYLLGEIYQCKLIELAGVSCSWVSRAMGSDTVMTDSPFAGNLFFPTEATIKVENCDGGKKIESDAGSSTFFIAFSKAIFVLELAKEQVGKKLKFNIFGHHNWFVVAKRALGGAPEYSCISWALEFLQYAGVGINVSEFSMLDFTPDYTQAHTRRPVLPPLLPLSTLCKWAASGNHKAIALNFPEGTDVDRLHSWASMGSVEVFLGVYTPLALASSYGHLETVKLLVGTYRARVNIVSGRFEDHTALDCAYRSFWGVNKGDATELKRYLVNNGGIAMQNWH